MDDLGDSIHTPLLCRQCSNMYCIEGEDLSQEQVFQEKNKFLWDNLNRALKCPFNGCFAFDGEVYHCDLCGGDPQCVKICTNLALTIID